MRYLCDRKEAFQFFLSYYHKQLVVFIPKTLSTIPPSTGQNKRYWNILLYVTSLISVTVGHFSCKHSCLWYYHSFLLLSFHYCGLFDPYPWKYVVYLQYHSDCEMRSGLDQLRHPNIVVHHMT